MIRRLATGVGVVVVAAALALASAWWMLLHRPQQSGIVNGAWRTSTTVGSVNADMYTRASVAITGLFALSAAEAIYFSATTDDAGAPLLARCRYVIAGKPVAARWWSITAYADDNFLIPNVANRFSYNMGNLTGEEGGAFRIVASGDEQPGNWLSTGRGREFCLLFRLYNAAPATLANLQTIALPTIKREGECR